MTPTSESIIAAILEWWKDHQYDVTGDYGDRNVYNDDPEFVALAKQYVKDHPEDF